MHSLLYFLLLAVVLAWFYREVVSQAGQRYAVLGTPVHYTLALACLFFIVDFSLTRSFAWVVARNSYMACLLGLVSIVGFIRWRKGFGRHWLVFGMLVFSIALLTAEAALSAAAYMGAYVLCMERQSVWRKALPLVPVVAVIVAWRVLYSSAGFGAVGIGLYVDPARSVLAFLSNVFTVFPLISAAQITGIDGLILFVLPLYRWVLVVAAWTITLLGIRVIWPFLKASPVDRFMFIGSVVAAVPATALVSAESRTVTFVSIGFFYLLARLTVLLWDRAGAAGWLRRLLLGWHLVIPAFVAFLITANLTGFSQQSQQHESVQGHIKPQKTGLLVLSSEYGGMMYYLPFDWAYRGIGLPSVINILTSGLETTDITRTSERQLLIRIPAGMPLSHNARIENLDRTQPAVSPYYAGLFSYGFFLRPEQQPRQGDVIFNADRRIEILAQNAVGPTLVQVDFIGNEHPDNKVWQWYDREARRYQVMEPLAIGDTRRFWGPLDRPESVQ